MKTTGLSRVSKDLIIKEIEKELKSRPAFFVTDHGTVPALALDKLRAKLRASNSRYLVIKKSLGRKALENANLQSVGELEGACGIAFTSGDIVLSSKTLVDFAKENESFKVRTGFMNGQVMTADKIKQLAGLPPKEVLLARVVGGMQAPIWRFVGVLSGTVRKVVNVLDAIVKKKGSG